MLLHERVGHDGLHALLNPSGAAAGDKPTLIQTRWANLQQHLLRYQRDVIESIAAEPGYAHLKGNTEGLALEWFARQAGARPELLTQPSLVMRMWDNFKDGVADLMARLGLDPLKGRDLDTQVMALLKRARQAALQGGNGPLQGGNGPLQGGALGQDLQFSMGGAGGAGTDKTQAAAAPEIQVLKPELLQRHQDNLTRNLALPRDEQAEALVREQEQRVQDPVTGTQAGRRRIEAETFTESNPIGGKHINETNHLKSPAGGQVVHKPAAGQVKAKYRAGIAPETTGRREVAASEVTEALGLDLVPPTTMINHGGQSGSAQAFKEKIVNGRKASKSPYNVEIDPKTKAPVHLPDDVAENWQLIDDLLMQSDRLRKNYMVRVNECHEVVEVALIDNGYSLPANTGVVEKCFPGPRENAPISPANQARLRRMLDNEGPLRKSVGRHLEEEALNGLFARARALLDRGWYLDNTDVFIVQKMAMSYCAIFHWNTLAVALCAPL